MPNLGKEFEELTARETYTGLDGKKPQGWSDREKEASAGSGEPPPGRQRAPSSNTSFKVGLS